MKLNDNIVHFHIVNYYPLPFHNFTPDPSPEEVDNPTGGEEDLPNNNNNGEDPSVHYGYAARTARSADDGE